MAKKKNKVKQKKPRYSSRMRGFVPMLERKRRAAQSDLDTGRAAKDSTDEKYVRDYLGLPDIDEVYEIQHGKRKRGVLILLLIVLSIFAFFVGAVVWRVCTG